MAVRDQQSKLARVLRFGREHLTPGPLAYEAKARRRSGRNSAAHRAGLKKAFAFSLAGGAAGGVGQHLGLRAFDSIARFRSPVLRSGARLLGAAAGGALASAAVTAAYAYQRRREVAAAAKAGTGAGAAG
jgi:hypothetical protein